MMFSRLAFRGSIVSTILFLTIASSPALLAKANPKFLHGDSIRVLESKASFTAEERYNLGRHHIALGYFYDYLARSTASATLAQAKCYSGYEKIAWGAEYFAALSLLQLGKPDSALRFCEAGLRRKTTPVLMAGLMRVLKAAIGTQSATAMTIDWQASAPKSYCDSLEVSSQAELSSGRFPYPKLSINPTRTTESVVTFTPLTTRAQLAQLLNQGKEDDLRKLLRQLESQGFPVWSIASAKSENPAVFSDPVLVSLASRAHYFLAERDFATVAAESDQKLTDAAKFKRVEVCFKSGMAPKADTLLGKMPDDTELLPYRGWVAWQRGDTGAASEYWRRYLDGADYRRSARMLEIWATIPGTNERAEGLIDGLLAGLGGRNEKKRLYNSPDGKERFWTTYRGIGKWYFQTRSYDSASLYYKLTMDVSGLPVNLENFALEVCAEYLSAKIFKDRIDIQQGGLEGWQELGRYYPSARAVIEPLSEASLCDSQRRMGSK